MNQRDFEVQVHPISAEDSSFVRGLNYMPSKNMLEVRLNKSEGEVSYFYRQPRSIFEEFRNADSYGSYYHHKLREGSHDRDWDSPLVVDQSSYEEIEQLLSQSTEELYTIVQENDPTFLSQHQQLFESVRRRKYDSFVLDLDDPELLELVASFRYGIIDKSVDIIESEYPDLPVWASNYLQSAEKLASKERTNIIAHTI